LAVNASKRAIEGVLFQLKRVEAGIEAAGTGNHRMVECLIFLYPANLRILRFDIGTQQEKHWRLSNVKLKYVEWLGLHDTSVYIHRSRGTQDPGGRTG